MKPWPVAADYAALKRRSSTMADDFVAAPCRPLKGTLFIIILGVLSRRFPAGLSCAAASRELRVFIRRRQQAGPLRLRSGQALDCARFATLRSG